MDLLTGEMANQRKGCQGHDEQNCEEDDTAVFKAPADRDFDAVQYPVRAQIEQNRRKGEIEHLHLLPSLPQSPGQVTAGVVCEAVYLHG